MTFDPKRDLKLTRSFAASPANVWRCWTEPDLLSKWFAPDPVTVLSAKVDPVPGGVFEVVMQIPGEAPMNEPPGCILLADPARRLVWTSALGPHFAPNPLGDAPGAFQFTADITLAPDGSGTSYTVLLRHARAADRDAHDAMGFEMGWGAAAAQLDALAQSL